MLYIKVEVIFIKNIFVLLVRHRGQDDVCIRHEGPFLILLALYYDVNSYRILQSWEFLKTYKKFLTKFLNKKALA